MSDPQHPNYRLQDLQRRWERDPSSRVYQQLAEEYRKAGQLVEAAVVLEDGLGRRPNDIAARVALGRSRLDLGQVSEAIEALENVISRDAAHHVANKLLLDAYLQAGALVQARERLNIYRLINDRDPELEHLGFRLEQLESGGAESGKPLPPSEARQRASEVTPQTADTSAGETIERISRETNEMDVVSAAELVAAEERRADEASSEQASDPAASEPPPPFDLSAFASPSLPENAAPSHHHDEIFVRDDADLNRPQEALNMPSHSANPEVNDVFNFGVDAPPADHFAALWADLGATPVEGDLPAEEPAVEISPPAPVVEAALLAAEPFAADPFPAEPPAVLTDDALAPNPFGQIAPPAVADVWQTLAQQAPSGSKVDSPVGAVDEVLVEPMNAAEPAVVEEVAAITTEDVVAEDQASETEEESYEGLVTSEVPFVMDDAPTEPLRVFATPTVASPTVDSPTAEAVDEDAETRPLIEAIAAPSAPEAPSTESVDTAFSEDAQSPWETAHQMAGAVGTQDVNGLDAYVQTGESFGVEAEAESPALESEPQSTELLSTEPPSSERLSYELQSTEPQSPATPEEVRPPVAETEVAVEVEAVEAEDVLEVEKTAGAEDTTDSEPTVTLGTLYLKQGHRDEAAGIFEHILRRDPGNQAALAGLNLARKPERAGLSALDLLDDQSSGGTIPAGSLAKKILILSNYLQHLKARGKENHVH